MRPSAAHPFDAPPLRPGPVVAALAAAAVVLVVSIGVALLACAGVTP